MEDAEGRQRMGTGGLGYLPAHLGHTRRHRKVPARISRPDPPFSRASLPAPGPAGSAVTGLRLAEAKDTLIPLQLLLQHLSPLSHRPPAMCRVASPLPQGPWGRVPVCGEGLGSVSLP